MKNMPTTKDPQSKDWSAGDASDRARRATAHATNTASTPQVKIQPSPATKNKVGIPNSENVMGKSKPFPPKGRV